MSVYVMTEVWQFSRMSGAQLLVLLALADRAQPEDGLCWPGIDDIARRARISKRQTYRIILQLISAGEVRKVESGGHGAKDTNTYQVTVGKYKGVAHVTLKGDKNGRKGDIRHRIRVTPMSPEPSVNRHIEPVVEIDPETNRYRLSRSEQPTSITDILDSKQPSPHT